MYKDENSPHVWLNLTQNLYNLSTLIVHTEYEKNFKDYLIKLTLSVNEKLAWKCQPGECILNGFKFI